MTAAAPPAAGRRQWWPAALLPVLLAIAWGPALVGPFQFDDRQVIVGYDAVHSLPAWWQAQPGIRPLLKLSYALNWTISPSARGFHAMNLALHALNASLLFAWLARVLPPERRRVAGVTALLWCLHPATTEAVTYVSGRSVSFAATFALLALLLQARGGRFVAPILAACTLLALAVRETLWILPAVLWLVAWLRGTRASVAWRETRGAFLVVTLATIFFLVDASHQRMLWRAFDSRDGMTQLWTQVEAWRWLVTQTLLAGEPNIDPDIPVRTTAGADAIATLVAAIAILAACAWRVIAARCVVAGGVLWYVLWLLPANGIVPRLDVANDRHLYLALAAPALALAWCLWSMPQRSIAWRAARGATITSAALLLGVLVLARNLDYVDEVSLWRSTVMSSPMKSRPWNNLGVACREAGDRDCARAAFTRALELDPGDLQAAVNLHFLDQPATGPAR